MARRSIPSEQHVSRQSRVMHFHASPRPDSQSGSASSTFTHLSSRYMKTAVAWSEMIGLVHSTDFIKWDYPNISTSHPAGYFRSTGRQCVSGLRGLILNPPVANRVSELLAPTTNLLWRGYAVAAARCLPFPRGMGQLPPQGASTRELYDDATTLPIAHARIAMKFPCGPPSYCTRRNLPLDNLITL